jgi:uncharacterized protein (DUF1330 family)
MAAYCLVDVREVTDPDGWADYRSKVGETVAAHGGRFIVVGGDPTVIEGDWHPRQLIHLEFPSREAMQTWWDSPQYQAIVPIRLASARVDVVFADGVQG